MVLRKNELGYIFSEAINIVERRTVIDKIKVIKR